MARPITGTKTAPNGLNSVNSFDILKHTPFLIKGFDATRWLKEAFDSKDPAYIQGILKIKEIYDIGYMDMYDIHEALEDTRIYYEDKDY